MRLFVIVMVILAVSFAAVAVYGIARDPDAANAAGGCGGPPPMRGGEVDEDALQDWCPPSFGALATSLLAWFGPSVALTPAPVQLGEGADLGLPVPAARDKTRVARFDWLSGAPVRISYPGLPGRDRAQTTCLCRPGATLDSGPVQACGESWIRRRTQAGVLTCSRDDDRIAIVLHPEPGTVTLRALGGSASVGQP